MTTKATNSLPEIDWQIGELMDKDIDERMEVYNATGKDLDENEYIGSAYYICGEFDGIKDIEKA